MPIGNSASSAVANRKKRSAVGSRWGKVLSILLYRRQIESVQRQTYTYCPANLEAFNTGLPALPYDCVMSQKNNSCGPSALSAIPRFEHTCSRRLMRTALESNSNAPIAPQYLVIDPIRLIIILCKSRFASRSLERYTAKLSTSSGFQRQVISSSCSA